MPDFLIDYETLYKLGTKAGELKKTVDDAQAHDTGTTRYTEDQLGSWTTPEVLGDFYQAWRYAFQRAQEVLGSVEGTFTSVAKAWFDQDAALAAGARQQAAQFDYADYQGRAAAYQSWEKLSQTYVTMHHWDESGNLVEEKVALADQSNKPDLPGEPPKEFNYTNPDGSTNNTTFTYGDDGKVKGTTTSVTNKDGLSYKENTSFSGDGGYKTDIDHSDGKSTHVAMVVSPDGSTGTRTLTDEDGKKTEYKGDLKDDPSTWSKTYDQKEREKQDAANAQNVNNPNY
ncbi:hypothetical protein [Streptomyces lunalinharesii]|uniref:YD repeat-containing protein n=1 Tax=Streptomyces lunalinharesii TaxID=333384 RepID=A0ABP6F3D2_9ACTN